MKKERGSFIVTFVIIALLVGAGVFYVKTSHPTLYQKAVSYIKTVGRGDSSLETVSDGIYDSITVPKDTVEQMSFDYLSPYSVVSVSQPLENAVVTSGFGSRTDPVTGKASATHHGIDLAAEDGSPILCYKAGTVSYTDTDPVYGNCVEVDHGGFSSFYAHMSRVSVSAGDTLSAGDTVGIIGSSGKSTGTHLHFEIRKNGDCLDPADYLYEKV